MKEILIDTCEFDFFIDKEKPENESWVYFWRFYGTPNEREQIQRIDFDKVEKVPNKFSESGYWGFNLFKDGKKIHWLPPHNFAFMFVIEE